MSKAIKITEETMGFITWLVFLSMILPLSTATWLYEIHVNRQNGINDTSCWEGGYSTPCLSLNLALKGVQHYNDSVTIILQPGRHQLQNSRETLLKNISRLAIVGNNSEGEVVIKCQPLTGLAFFGCKNITIQNVTIVSCGMLQNSTILKEDSVFQWVQVAILFSACEIVQIENVLFTESNGTGVVINNPVEVVQLDMCTFSHNFLSSEQAHDHEGGGGGLVIETNSSQSNCTISNCTFVNNTVSALDLSIPSRGGGISIVFRGEAASNTIQINNVYLVDNKALFGGGIFLAFYDNAHGNSITIDGLIVTKNYAMVKVGILLSLLHSSGGGIAINFAASDVDYPFNNTVEINNGEFVSNAAQLGGGLAVIVTAHFNISAGNTLLIENCTFDHNIAYGKGSSAYFLNRKTSFLNTTVSNSNFTNGTCWENTGARLLCLGSLVMSNFSLTFKGTLLFSSNSLSALSLRSSSSIELYPSTKLKFINNNGLDGGAINIIECSSIIVNNNTELYFENNTASHYGGAIYAEACSKTEGDCFIRHSNRAMSPDDWNTNFSFYGNQASSASFHGNSIYTDSILSCVWPDYNKDETFCWKEWSFWYAPQFSVSFIRDNCLNQLRSGPAYINSTGITKYAVNPGQCIDLDQFINVYDDYDNVLYPTNLKAGLLFGASRLVSDPQDCQCINPVYDDLCGTLHESNQPCSSNQVALLSASCNESYANHTSKILVHLPNQLYGVVVKLIFNQCDKGSYCNAAGSCFRPNPPVYKSVCSNTSSFIKSSECDDTLCGSCAEDQNVSIVYNSPLFACMKCDDAFPGVAFYMLEIFLVLVMMTVLAVFHINITNGNLNAYILYSQMLTLQFPGLTYSAWTALFRNSSNFINASFIVYSIWNLSFLSWYPFPICIPKLQTAVQVIILQYIVAALPLLFIIVSYIWIKWYSNGYRLVVYTTRPVHRLLARFWQKFKIQPSLIDTYAGLLLLAYMRFLAVSVKLLQFVTIDQTLSYSALLSLAQAITLVLVAIVCLLVFVILPMAVLLLYPFMIFQRCLTCCKLDRPGLHALVDAYQGCFKNSATDGSEMRYFAGLYLLFRFCYVAILVFPLSTLKYHDTANNAAYYDIALPVAEACLGFLLAGLVLLLRPYKNIAHNMIDFLTLFFMTLLLNFIGLFLLPFFILLIYTIFRVLKSCCCCACKTRNASDNEAAVPAERQPLLAPALPTRSEVAFDNENELYPDRICNPDGYNKYNQYRPLSELHSQ